MVYSIKFFSDFFEENEEEVLELGGEVEKRGG
jgi:hypothetical protein